MNLLQHVINIREVIDRAFDGKLERLGIEASSITERPNLSDEDSAIRTRLINITNTHLEEKKGDYKEARSYTLKQCVFTMFNRLAALKLMENKEILVESIRQRPEYGGISQDHLGWLEEHPEGRQKDRQGLVEYFTWRFAETSKTIPLYKADYPYSLMPTADELNDIIVAFNAIDKDPDTAEAWKGDDILGWLYENFNVVEKNQFKESDEKTEYHKVSLQSQVYTPDWVVKFLVDNTLGKMYLEMYPDSVLGQPDFEGNYKYPIANKPASATREKKDVKEIRVIDPACGSGNFLLYAFDLLYDMYLNQNEQYGKNYNEKEIPKLIVENNLYGVDLDERAVQLAQIALMIKAREIGGRRAAVPQHTNIVSTNFFLPDTEEVQNILTDVAEWSPVQKKTVKGIWSDLCQAYKFGTLVRVEEKLQAIEPDHDNMSLYSAQEINDLFSIKNMATEMIRKQVSKWGAVGSNAYTLAKANDAVSFLEILSRKFDVVVANPPYTDSGDFGPELKAFVEENYKKPFKFNSNLYACFIKRCCELAGYDGKVGMIHPMTFMYIKSFEDVRKYMLNNTRINLFVEYGLSNLFGTVMVDPAFYTLDMNNKQEGESIFISLDQHTRTPEEKNKKRYCLEALNDICNSNNNKHVYTLPQSKLKGIKSYPFIYWISDEFREKFGSDALDDVIFIRQGGATGNNERTLRFHWEVDREKISKVINDKKDYVFYPKGGPFRKWYGNNWVVIAYNNPVVYEYLKTHGNNLPSESFYLKEGVTYCSSGSRGCSFRYLPANQVISGAGPGIYPSEKYNNILYYLAFLNSKLSTYMLDCLNPTVNVTQGDIKRVPFAQPNEELESVVERLASLNVKISEHLCEFSIIEASYKQSPINANSDINTSLASYFNNENALITQILLNESIINYAVFEVYDLNASDKQMVLDKEGIPVGDLPVSPEAKVAYKEWLTSNTEFPASAEVLAHLDALEERTDITRVDDFDTLYTNNKEWEEFCIQHNMNPVEVWYQFKNANVLPPQRTQALAFELLTDVIRTILAKDDDGIIPLTDRAGEETLLPRIEAEMIERGYSNAQIAQVFSLVCGNARGGIQAYLGDRFFQQLSDHLNLFMYLPKTPFIWHITSGENHAMELFISIYKWNRDVVMRIKSVYVANRESALNDRLQMLLQGDASQKAEAAEVKAQLAELKAFTDKLDTLLDTNGYNYNPKLDDGVGKNIAPLQKLGIISCEVLKTSNGKNSQLNKYLNADW